MFNYNTALQGKENVKLTQNHDTKDLETEKQLAIIIIIFKNILKNV